MGLADISLWQWLLASAASLLVGFAKAGVPGVGILAVPLMAEAFGARASVGILLPLLICADCTAVCWYRRHAQWDKLAGLAPWVVIGLALGIALMWQLDQSTLLGLSSPQLFALLVGGIVLLMLGLHLLRRRLGNRLTPSTSLGLALAGTATGVATTTANAAGPVMTVYLAGKGMSKESFVGTNAWFFLLLNLSKVPLYLVLAALDSGPPLLNSGSLSIDLCLLPCILPGALLGRWLLPRLRQHWFDQLVLWLAFAAALKLCATALLA